MQLSYAIGVAEPTSILVEDFGTSHLTRDELVAIIKQNFKLDPQGIIKSLNLQAPIYKQTAAYGHFGQDHLPWEQIIDLKLA